MSLQYTIVQDSVDSKAHGHQSSYLFCFVLFVLFYLIYFFFLFFFEFTVLLIFKPKHVGMQGITDQKISEYGHFLRSVC